MMAAMFSGVDVTAALIAGLLGSLHCIAMCGPLATVGCRASRARGSAFDSLLFTLGKLGSYSVLGLIAGTVGGMWAATQLVEEMSAWLGVIGGTLMVSVIILSRIGVFGTGSVLARVGGWISRAAFRAGTAAPLMIGFAAALLPCGLLYAMVARSAASGTPVEGMVLMQAFGVGTMPAFLGLGALLKYIPARFAKYGGIAGDVLLVIMGMVLIWRGIAAFRSDGAPACCG